MIFSKRTWIFGSLIYKYFLSFFISFKLWFILDAAPQLTDRSKVQCPLSSFEERLQMPCTNVRSFIMQQVKTEEAALLTGKQTVIEMTSDTAARNTASENC